MLMSRRAAEEESWENDDDWDPDEPSLEDLETDGELPTVPCPYCKRPLPEDVARCPYCERYVSAEDVPGEAPTGRKPWWIIIGALLVFFIVYHWIAK